MNGKEKVHNISNFSGYRKCNSQRKSLSAMWNTTIAIDLRVYFKTIVKEKGIQISGKMEIIQIRMEINEIKQQMDYSKFKTKNGFLEKINKIYTPLKTLTK